MGMSLGLILAPLIAMTGAAVDYAQAVTARDRLQATTDAAAINAARVNAPSDAQRIAAAEAYFPASSSVTAPTATVTVSNGSVSVVSTQRVKTAFLGIVGISEMVLNAKATAAPIKDGPPVCALALNQTAPAALNFSGNATFSAPGCGVYSNSSFSSGISVQGSAVVQAAGYCSAGGVSSSHALTPASNTSCSRLEDPFRNLPAPSIAGCSFEHGLTVNPNTTRALSPGTYCGGLNLKGTVTLSPGLYIIKDGSFAVGSQANVSVSGSGGVTFYLTGQGAAFDLDGSGGLSLLAQDTGPYSGLLIIQDRASNVGGTSKLNGTSSTLLKGAIYLPTQILSVNGNGSFGQQSDFMPLIADQLSFSGNSSTRLDLTAMQTPAPLPRFSSGAQLLY